ncbi:MAG: DUF2206 domain-containing protein [Acidimicrobiales bacterium]
MVGLSQSQLTNEAPAWWRRLVADRGTMFLPTWLICLVVLDIAVAGNSLWLLRAASVLLLAVLPGQLLLRALKIPASAVRRYIAYLPCASVAVLIATTLVVDLAAPLLGVHEPLRRLPLLVGLNLALPALAIIGNRAGPLYELKSSDLIGRLRWLWPLLLPLLSIVAAERLDNGHGNALALLVLVLVAVMIPVCTVLANRLHSRQIGFILYASGLSLLLLTSMRSAYVIGFDINSEYFDFHQTVLNGIWHLGHMNAYEAMLSLTVLPASLHALVGGQDVWIFKLGYPALFALFPVAVFELGTRFLSRRAAFIAAALVVSQAYFFQQQPEIARQELALLIFAGMIGALFDTSLGRSLQLRLVSVLAVTLVVCHYSTTYVAIFLCISASLLAILIPRGKRVRLPVAPWLVAAAVMTVSAVIWYLPATHSTSDITATAQSIHRSGFEFLPGRRKGESILSAYFNGVREQPSSPKQYQQNVASYYSEHLSFLIPLPAATDPAYNLHAAPAPQLPDHAPFIVSILSDAELLVQQTINALAAIGALILTLRRRELPLSRMIGVMGFASLFVLAASRLSGSLSADYNSSRLFLQCLLVLALVEASLIENLVTRLKGRSWVGPLLFGGFSLMLLVAFLGNSGLATPIVGGDPPLILYNKGEDYTDLYPSAQEKVTAQWLAAVVPPHRVIYADYFGQLRLDQYTDLRSAVFNDITPRTIDQHAWVFASRANVVDHVTWGLTSAGPLDITFPASFLGTYFNIVYSTGSTEVFHR